MSCATQALREDHTIPDPGAGGKIVCRKSPGVVELVTAAAEARTVGAPTRAGLQMTLSLKTDGGDCTITFPAAVNAAGNTICTLDTAGKFIEVQSHRIGTTLTWRRTSGDGDSLS